MLNGSPFLFLDVEVDPAEGRVRIGGAEVELQPKVFEALVFLARNAGRLVTKDELLAALWPDTVVEEGSLTQVVFKLCRALGDIHSEPRVVQTVLKRGFRFLPDVRETARLAAAPAPTAAAQPPAESPREPEPPPADAAEMPGSLPELRPRRRPPIAAVVAAGVLVAGLGVWLYPRVVPAPDARTAGASVPPVLQRGTHPVRRLTFFPEREQEPCPSPDGTWFAFASKREGKGRFKIWAGRLAGGDPVRLSRSDAEETTPRVAPDGRWIAYTRCESEDPRAPGCAVWRMAALGGDERLLVPDCTMGDIHPGGGGLACVRSAATGRTTVLSWSFESGEGAALVDLGDPIDLVAWSPAGDRLAFVSRGAPWLVDAAGGPPVRVLEDGAEMLTASFSWDGRHLLGDGSFGGRRTIWAVPLDGGERVEVTTGSGLDLYPAMARDGRSVLYAHETWHRILWRSGPGGVERLDTRSSLIDVSVGASGRSLAFCDEDSPSGDTVGLLDLGTGATRGLGSGARPALSPDETRVALVDGGSLVVLDLRTGRRTVRAPAADVRPAWAPDGRRIAFRQGGDTPGLAVVDAGEGAVRSVALGQLQTPSWSADGTTLAASGVTVEGSGLHVVDVATGRARRVSVRRSYEAAPIWTAEGSALRVLVDERTAAALVTVRLDGTESDRQALAAPDDPTHWGIFDAQPLPGGQLLYVEQRVEGDIYAVEAAPEH